MSTLSQEARLALLAKAQVAETAHQGYDGRTGHRSMGSRDMLEGSWNFSADQTFTVWVDGLPRVAIMGSRGLEVQGGTVDRLARPFDTQGAHPFIANEARQVGSPPPPPPLKPDGWFSLTRSPMTPNGTRVPKEPPPVESFQWPDWTLPLGDTATAFHEIIPPPPLPPDMRSGEGNGKPEEPSRSVTELPVHYIYPLPTTIPISPLHEIGKSW